MHLPVHDRHKFWQVSPAAAQIFNYVDTTPEVKDSPWGFDSGNVSDDRTSTWAHFSCVALSGGGRDELIVSASRQASGDWKLKHTIKRAP